MTCHSWCTNYTLIDCCILIFHDFMSLLIAEIVRILIGCQYDQACSQPSDNGWSFSSDFGPFQGLKVGGSSGCLRKTLIFKIIMIDDVTLCTKLESTW